MARIAVVEDDLQSAMIVERMVSRIGKHDVCVTDSPEVVISMARQGQLDLVLLDVSLSNSSFHGQRVDGPWLSRKLKTDPELPPIPVIVITAHAMRGDRERIMKESLADAYLTKPVLDYRALCALIEEKLAERRSEKPAPDSACPTPQ